MGRKIWDKWSQQNVLHNSIQTTAINVNRISFIFMQFSAKKDALYISFRPTGRTPDDLLEKRCIKQSSGVRPAYAEKRCIKQKKNQIIGLR